MATSEVSLCNSALALLAANRITALGDDSQEESLICEDLFPEVRDQIIESNDWTFATERIQLGASASSPVFGFDYEATLPSEVLRVLGVWEDPDSDKRGKYKVEGSTIRTDFSPVYVKYIKQITDVTKISPMARKAIYLELAAQLCVPLTEDMKRQENLSKMATFALDEAAALDGIQGSQERVTSDAFIRVR